jgi:hypothetical protein
VASGANVHSCRKEVVDLDDLGISEEEWEAMTDEQQSQIMYDVAFGQADWGFTEVGQ